MLSIFGRTLLKCQLYIWNVVFAWFLLSCSSVKETTPSEYQENIRQNDWYEHTLEECRLFVESLDKTISIQERYRKGMVTGKTRLIAADRPHLVDQCIQHREADRYPWSSAAGNSENGENEISQEEKKEENEYSQSPYQQDEFDENDE